MNPAVKDGSFGSYEYIYTHIGDGMGIIDKF